MAKVTKAVRKVTAAEIAQAASRESLSAIYKRIKGRALTNDEWGEITAPIHKNDLCIYYASKVDPDQPSTFREIMVLSDLERGYVAWHVLSTGHSKEWSQDRPAPTYRALELDPCETAEQAFMDAANYLANEKPEIYITSEEMAELHNDALFKVDFNGDWYFITDNMRAKYTFWQVQADDLQVVVQKTFDTAEEAKQCVRGQIAGGLEDKLEDF